MLANQRHQWILEEVRQHGAVRVSDLVEELEVSDMTIRRDIATLADKGMLTRVHGGATGLSPRRTGEPRFMVKAALQTAEKAGIALAAAALVRPGDSVALSAGTTTAVVAQNLCGIPELTVVTNSLPVEDVFNASSRPDRAVILTGGTRTPSNALVGPVAVAMLRSVHVDWLFLGVHGFDEHAGLTTPNLLESETNRALIDCARRVIVVADSSKAGVTALSSMARLGEVDILITDDSLDPKVQRVLRNRVGELVLAPPLETASMDAAGGDRRGT